jgi:hypothetical protein
MQIPQEDHVKYLGLYLTKMYWLLGRKSNLSTNNKFLIYKAVLKPIWTYGIQLWGTTYNSNIEILERFQSKVLMLIVNAPWYASDSVIRNDLQVPTVKEEISRFSSLYAVRLRAHTNEPIATLTEKPIHKHLRRHGPTTCYQILAYFFICNSRL